MRPLPIRILRSTRDLELTFGNGEVLRSPARSESLFATMPTTRLQQVDPSRKSLFVRCERLNGRKLAMVEKRSINAADAPATQGGIHAGGRDQKRKSHALHQRANSR